MRAQEISRLELHRFRFKRLACLGVVFAGFFWSAASLARDVDVFGPVRDERPPPQDSEQTLAVELRFGPYLPALPNQTGATPSFGDQIVRSHRIMAGIEADWQALRLPGVLSIGPGAGMGYTKLGNNGTYAGQDYSANLKIWTQWVEAVVRLDILQQKYGIPFVFSGKFGAARASWWSSNRPYYNNAVSVSDSGSAQGLAWALGAMFDLGILEPERARMMDTISGVNHMYLFWEWYQLNLNDFGRGTNAVGDSTWAMGWAMDM